MIPREVLLCGTCLVGSTEVIRKLPAYERLPHGYGCIAIEDVNDVDALSEALAAIVRNPRAATAIGARGRQFALALQRDMLFPQNLERTLEAAAARQKIPHAAGSLTFGAATPPAESRFPLTQLVAAAIGQPFGRPRREQCLGSGRTSDRSRLRGADVGGRRTGHRRWSHGSRAARCGGPDRTCRCCGGGRGRTERSSSGVRPAVSAALAAMAYAEDGLAGLAPVRDPQLRILEFDHDVADFLGARTAADLPAVTRPGPSYIVAFGGSGGGRREPLLVDGLTAHILMLSDGKRSAAELARELDRQSDASVEADNLKWIEHLFVCGLIGLRDRPTDTGSGISSNDVGPDGPHCRCWGHARLIDTAAISRLFQRGGPQERVCARIQEYRNRMDAPIFLGWWPLDDLSRFRQRNVSCVGNAICRFRGVRPARQQNRPKNGPKHRP